MIIYENTRSGFINDIRTGSIASKVQNAFERHGIHHNNDAEFRAWGNSLMYIITGKTVEEELMKK